MAVDIQIPKHVLDAAAANVAKRKAMFDAFVGDLCARHRVNDAQLAPLWGEKLRHTFSTIPETIYPDLVAVNGGVIPIDTSVNPASLEWEYFMIDSGALCDWIDDEGNLMHSSFVTATRHTGKHAEIGGGYEYTIFDLEKAALANVPLNQIKAKAVKRAHDEKTEWVWLFGDSAMDIPGLCTHPNVTTSFAAIGAGLSRLPINKTNDEILADFVTLLDTIPQQTIEGHHAAKGFMPHSLIRLMRSRFLEGTASGVVSLWDRLRALYSGDDSGQGKVEFKGLNPLDANRRINPVTGTDTSGISGDFLVAVPADDKDSLAFIRARSFTQRPPQEVDFNIKILTHGNIGGVKMVYPLSCHVMFFGTT